MSGGRRSSIFAGLLLVALGMLFLIGIFRPDLRLGHWIAVYWPLLLIFWGVAKILDYMAAQHYGEPRPKLISGGEAVLVALLVVALGGFVVRDWARHRFPKIHFQMPEFGPSFSRSESLPPQTLPPNSRLAIDIRSGDISVEGRAGDDLMVKAQKKIWGLSQTSADRALQQAQVKVENSGGLYRLHPLFDISGPAGGTIDLTLQAPASSSVAASTNEGDIRISNIHGSTQAHTGDGDIEVQNAGGDVLADQHGRACRGVAWPPCGSGGDTRIAGVHGNVRVTGRGDDVSISDVNGSASVDGQFNGTIRARHVEQGVRCAVPWSAIATGPLNGTLEADLGDLSISGASGPTRIATHNTDIDLKNMSGRLDIADTHGDIKVALTAPPRDDIHITDDAGDVDLRLPADSSFRVQAVSRGGDVQSDFAGAGLNVTNMNGNGQISGTVGAPGGPTITIATTYGTIRLRKGD